MLEFKAIAFAAMSRPPELVRQTFIEAEFIDKTNKRVLTNLANYEMNRAVLHSKEWYILKIDPAMVRDELPLPRTLQESEKPHHQLAG